MEQFHTGSGDNINGDKIDRQINIGENSVFVEQNTGAINIQITLAELIKEGPKELIEEWTERLDEVSDNIEKFKPKTALAILERLEARINEKGINVLDALKGKIIYLKAVCLTELLLGGIEANAAELFVKAYKYCPDNVKYEADAGLAYLAIKEKDKAAKVANGILNKDEYHATAWALKLFLEGDDFQSFLVGIPTHVKNKLEFKAQVGHWITNAQYIRTIAELDGLGFDFDVSMENEPPTITYKNKWYWIIAIQYLINKLYEQYPIGFSVFDQSICEDGTFKFTHSILGKLTKAVEGSEIEDKYAWHRFQLLYLDYVISQDVSVLPFLEVAFDKISDKRQLEVIQMNQVHFSAGKDENTLKAIKTIEGFGEDKHDVLSLFNSFNYLQLKDTINSVRSIKRYLSFHQVISEVVFYNLIQCLNSLQKQSADGVKEVKIVVAAIPFETQILKDLFAILTAFSDEPLKTDDVILERLKSEIDSDNELLRFYAGLALFMNAKPAEAALFLKGKVDKTKASDELRLYCKSLFKCDGDKLELLDILENWRRTLPLDYSLIHMELKIRELQNRWDIVVEIASQALGAFPDDEFLIYTLFNGLDNISQGKEAIGSNLSLVEPREFVNERIAVAISGILLKAGFVKESLELLYRTAFVKSNTLARTSYISTLGSFPNELFADCSIVGIGTYVEYEHNGNVDIIFMNEDNAKTPQGKALLNKAVGDFAIVGTNELLGQQVMISVKRILNKYSALSREIFKEAENPFSLNGIEVIKYDGTDVKSMTEALIESLGAVGSMQKELREKELDGYYNGMISFSEIASWVFNKNRIDAYFTLTSPQCRRFRAISPALSNPALLDSESRFILDATSLCLFCQLSKELGLTFEHKFIISASLRRELISMITETEIKPEVKLSVDITTKGVTPHFYQEGYKIDRIKFLQEILDWLDQNCEIDQVDEKLSLLLEFESNGQPLDNFLTCIVDCALLVGRHNHFLLTNDISYYRLLKVGSIHAISPLLYIDRFQNTRSIDCCNFMLKSNYVGIPISFEVLKDEFIKLVSGQENRYSICLENFNYQWNPNPDHVKVIAQFAKWIFLSPSFMMERKTQTVNNLFMSVLRGAPRSLYLALQKELTKEFRLLGDLGFQVQQILLTCFQILNRGY